MIVIEIKFIHNIPNLFFHVDKTDSDEIVVHITEKDRKTLGDAELGSTVKIGGRKYIVLRHDGDMTAVITKDFVKEMAFGNTGDYLNSDIRRYCIGEFYEELCQAVGPENIVGHDVDLTADDGSGTGAQYNDFVSILTADRYRMYSKYLPAVGDWWWLATRVSADKPDYARFVRCVYSSGVLNWNVCDYSGGVRPFCTLNSSVLVE